MDLGLKGRVALVTGASMGIGEAAAIELAGEGCDLAICSRHAGQLAEVCDQVMAKGVRCVVAECDIRNPGDITALMNEVARAYGRLDILVNNAGAATHGTFASLSDEQLLADYELKILGQLRCTSRRAGAAGEESGAARDQRQRDRGAGGDTELSDHHASRLVLRAQQGARLGTGGPQDPGELGEYRLVRTNQIERAHARRAPDVPLEKFMTQAAQIVPLKRFGEPHEILGPIAFLASDRAGFITGAVMDVRQQDRRARVTRRGDGLAG